MGRWGLLAVVGAVALTGCGSTSPKMATTRSVTTVLAAPVPAPSTTTPPNADSIAQQIESDITTAIAGGCWTSTAGERNNYEENVFFTDAEQVNQNYDPDPSGTQCAGTGGSGNAVTVDRYRTAALAKADAESLISDLGEISTIYLDGPVEVKLFNSSPSNAISAVEAIPGLTRVATT